MHYLLSLLLWMTSTAAFAVDINTGDPFLDQTFKVLLGRDFGAKLGAIEALEQSEHPQREALIDGVASGHLQLHKKSKRLVWVEKKENSYQATDAFNGELLGTFKKRKLKKIAINNEIRRYLQGTQMRKQLQSEDVAQRLEAVTQLLDASTESDVATVQQLLPNEQNEAVREGMTLLLALSQLGSESADRRLSAINTLSESLQPAVRNRLLQLAESDPDGAVRKAAADTIERIEERIRWLGHLETLFFGVSAGSVLVLAAIGLAITFGVMGVINMAHGELIMLGAYVTYLIQQLLPEAIGLSLLLAVPAAFLVSGLMGILIERGVIRFLYGRPLETLLATFGISLVLQQLVRTLISPQNVPVANPEFMSGFIEINSALSLTYNRLYIILFCLMVFVLLFVVLKRTTMGLQIRAVSQNRMMARAMGVRSDRIDALTFGLGAGIAGVAGVALSQLTNVGPNLGQAYIVDSFMVVVFGGVGNLWGTLVGGLSLGIANKFMEPWAGAVMAKILVLVAIILFIQKRPRGLFPQKGRAAEG